jgi:hypothetical protein
MKTTTMSSLTSVAPAFAESETRPAYTSADKRRLGIIALLLSLVVIVAFGSAVISQSPAVAREMAAVKSSLRTRLDDVCRGADGYGASAKYLPEQYIAAQLPRPSPTAWVWDLAGLRPF